MLNLPPSTKILLCNKPVDLRKSFDALSGLVQSHFHLNPLCGHLFVFFSKQGDRMKILFWDIDGFVVYYKRLEAGSYSWVDEARSGLSAEILATDFALLLLAGINPTDLQRSDRYKRTPENSLC